MAPNGLQIDGGTTLFGIVGDPIAQARSPLIYNPQIVAAGANAALVPIHLRAGDFDASIRGVMAIANLGGLVMTLPFKERAVTLADRVLDVGRMVGAINALRREPDGTWTGEMFDGVGLVRALATIDIAPAGRRFMLLGAGGAGSAIAISLALEGAAEIAVFDIDTARSGRRAERVRGAAPACAVRVGAPLVDGVDVLINATPVGMAPGDGLPAPFGPLPAALTVVDIVPKPPVTPLMAHAAQSGCVTLGGAVMVEGQSRAVLEFFGISPLR